MKSEPAAASLGKILVIDDNLVIQRAVYFALRDRGYRVIMAGEIAEALKLVHREKPDLILLDLNFPPDASIGGGSRDGFWALGWMRRMAEVQGVPIAIISSDPPEKSEARALAAGATAYFHKPMDREKLADAIIALLAQKTSAPPPPAA